MDLETTLEAHTLTEAVFYTRLLNVTVLAGVEGFTIDLFDGEMITVNFTRFINQTIAGEGVSSSAYLILSYLYCMIFIIVIVNIYNMLLRH